MPITIGSNIASLMAQRQVAASTSALNPIFQRLSSGLRINSASDDASGLSIATSLKADSHVFTQAIRNVNDAISLSHVADSALSSLSDITVRLTELASEAANGTYSGPQREALDSESGALIKEYNRITQTTTFNGRLLFDPNGTNLSVQLGYDFVDHELGDQLAQNVNDGTFQAAVSVAGSTGGGQQRGLATGDFNGDGNADYVYHGSAANSFEVMFGNGDGTFYSGGALAAGSGGEVMAADLNGDGVDDVVFAQVNNGRISVAFGQKGGSFSPVTSYNVGGQPETLALGDIDGDGDLDIAFGSYNSNRLAVLVNNGNATFHLGQDTTIPQDASISTSTLSMGDINGDGRADLAYDDGSNGITLALGQADGTFGSFSQISGINTQRTKFDDFDDDGNLDMATLTGASLSIFLGNGNGTFKARTDYSVGANGTAALSSGDLNGDRIDDIISSSDTGFQISFGNGDGTFQAAISLDTSANIHASIQLADFDNNGSSDILGFSSSSNDSQLVLGNTMKSNTLFHADLDLRSRAGALRALDALKEISARVIAERGSIGAFQQRLEVSAENLSTGRVNYDEAASRIMDTDIGEDSSKLVSTKILQQGAVAVLAQANQQPAIALNLLRNT